MGTASKGSGRGRLTSGLGRVATAVFVARRKVATCGALVLTVMVGYHVVFGQNGLTAYKAKQHEAHALSDETHILQIENDRLRDHVERLSSDPNSIEHEAREALHYARPGEVIYTLPDTRASGK